MLITAMIRIDCAAIYVVFKKFLALISDRLLREIRWSDELLLCDGDQTHLALNFLRSALKSNDPCDPCLASLLLAASSVSVHTHAGY